MTSSTPSKVRSPNYPTISLRDAVARVRKIYDQEQRHPADRLTIASALGYGTLNGASITMISALVKYGLLEPAGERDCMRVSSTAIDILIHERGEPERVRAVQRAALRPPLFVELRDRYPNSMPSESNLRAYLTKRGFNQRGVDAAVRAYRDTMAFLDEETQGFVVGAEEDEADIDAIDDVAEGIDLPAWESTPQDVQAILRALRMGQGQEASQSDAATSRSLPPQDGSGHVVTYRISEDAEVRLEFKGHVTQEAIDKLIKHLELSQDTYPKRDTTQAQSHAVPVTPSQPFAHGINQTLPRNGTDGPNDA